MPSLSPSKIPQQTRLQGPVVAALLLELQADSEVSVIGLGLPGCGDEVEGWVRRMLARELMYFFMSFCIRRDLWRRGEFMNSGRLGFWEGVVGSSREDGRKGWC